MIIEREEDKVLKEKIMQYVHDKDHRPYDEEILRRTHNPKYFVSNMGNVYSIVSSRFPRVYRLWPIVNPQTLHQYISMGGKRVLIARLVAEAFCEHPEGCTEVMHIDNDTFNNNAENLKWVTHKENHNRCVII